MEGLLWSVTALLFGLAACLLFGARKGPLLGLALLVTVTAAVSVAMGLWQAGIALCTGGLVLLLGLAFGDRLVAWPAARYVLLTLVVGAGLASVAVTVAAPLSALPAPGGPYAVGSFDTVVVDTGRSDVRGAAQDSPRELLVRAYYPSGQTPQGQARSYLSTQEAISIAAGENKLGKPGFLNSHLRHVPTHTYRDLPVLQTGALPLLIHSSGFSAHVGNSAILLSELASHGYVVLSLSHPGDMSAVVYPDGRSHLIADELVQAFAQRKQRRQNAAKPQAAPSPGSASKPFDQLWRETEGFNWVRLASGAMHQSHRIWIEDTRFLMAAIAADAIPEELRRLLVHTESDSYSMMGTSFGGSVAVSACHRDPQCRSAINIDGSSFDAELINNTARMPVLSLQHDFSRHPQFAAMRGFGLRNPTDTSYEENHLAGRTGLVDRVEVAGMVHQSFNDNTWFTRGSWARQLTAVGPLPSDRSVDITSSLVRAHLDSHLRGDGGAFESVVAALPEATLYTPDTLRQWAAQRD